MTKKWVKLNVVIASEQISFTLKNNFICATISIDKK
jgi:hypothetical protein